VSYPGGRVDFGRAGDASLGDFVGDVNDGGDDALGDEAGAVGETRDFGAVGVDDRLGNCRGGHEGEAAVPLHERIDAHAPRGI
jgi:hypothetical protein